MRKEFADGKETDQICALRLALLTAKLSRRDTFRSLESFVEVGRIAKTGPFRHFRDREFAELKQLEQDGVLRVRQGCNRLIRMQDRNACRKTRVRQVILLTPHPLEEMEGYVSLKVARLEQYLQRAGIYLEILNRKGCYSSRQEAALANLAAQYPDSCWILQQSTIQMQSWFRDRGLPVVLNGGNFEGFDFPSVDLDQRAVSRHAAGLLISRGHRRICFLGTTEPTAGSEAALEGFRDALSGNGRSGLRPIIVRSSNKRDNILSNMKEIIGRRDRPTAIIVQHAHTTLTVIGYLTDRGLRIPEDIAIICTTDALFFKNIYPSVARYSRNLDQMIHRLGEAVTQVAAGNRLRGKRIVLIPDFIAGASI